MAGRAPAPPSRSLKLQPRAASKISQVPAAALSRAGRACCLSFLIGWLYAIQPPHCAWTVHRTSAPNDITGRSPKLLGEARNLWGATHYWAKPEIASVKQTRLLGEARNRVGFTGRSPKSRRIYWAKHQIALVLRAVFPFTDTAPKFFRPCGAGAQREGPHP